MLILKRVKIIIALTILAFSLVFAGQFLFGHSHAHAQASCTENGFKNWNGFDWNPDGKDCWCSDRKNVSNPCETEPELK